MNKKNTTVNLDELKDLREQAMVRGAGSPAWIKSATAFMDAFPKFYEMAKKMNDELAQAAAQPAPAPGYCKHCKQYSIEEPLPAAQPAPVQQAEQEPVAKFTRWGEKGTSGEGYTVEFLGERPLPPDGTMFYASAQPAPVPLPIEKVIGMDYRGTLDEHIRTVRMTESAHGITNPDHGN